MFNLFILYVTLTIITGWPNGREKLAYTSINTSIASQVRKETHTVTKKKLNKINYLY